jgi:hypothetical protein
MKEGAKGTGETPVPPRYEVRSERESERGCTNVADALSHAAL